MLGNEKGNWAREEHVQTHTRCTRTPQSPACRWQDGYPDSWEPEERVSPDRIGILRYPDSPLAGGRTDTRIPGSRRSTSAPTSSPSLSSSRRCCRRAGLVPGWRRRQGSSSSSRAAAAAAGMARRRRGRGNGGQKGALRRGGCCRGRQSRRCHNMLMLLGILLSGGLLWETRCKRRTQYNA